MLSEQQQRIMGYFIEEAKDHLNTLEQGLLNLQSTIADPEMVSEVFRAAHSVKGGAAMLGLTSIQHTAHRLEDYFKILKECPVKVDQRLESLFLRVFDTLQELVDQLQGPFGLTDDRAQEAMAEVEPVFAELGQHLTLLVSQSGSALPEDLELPIAAPVKPAPKPPAIAREESALQLIFQSDVPAQLREMLQVFKQADTSDSRQRLQQICRTLSRLGEQLDLPNWCTLLGMAEGAIGNPDNTYRTLAPVVIKEIKRAQEQVLVGDQAAITAGQALLELMPPQAEDEITDTFDDLLAAVDVAQPLSDLNEPSIFDDFSDFADSSTPSPFEADLSDPLSDNWFNPEPPELPNERDQSDVLPASTLDSQEAEGLDFDLRSPKAERAELDFSALDFSSNTTQEMASDSLLPLEESGLPQASGNLNSSSSLLQEGDEYLGSEMSAIELNSLADLFEGEVPNLGLSWEEEPVDRATEQFSETSEVGASNDFSDFLFDQDGVEDLVLDGFEEEDLSGLLESSSQSFNISQSSDPAGNESETDRLFETIEASGHELQFEIDSSQPEDFADALFGNSTQPDETEEDLFGVSTTGSRNADAFENLDDLMAGLEDIPTTDLPADTAASELGELDAIFGEALTSGSLFEDSFEEPELESLSQTEQSSRLDLPADPWEDAAIALPLEAGSTTELSTSEEFSWFENPSTSADLNSSSPENFDENFGSENFGSENFNSADQAEQVDDLDLNPFFESEPAEGAIADELDQSSAMNLSNFLEDDDSSFSLDLSMDLPTPVLEDVSEDFKQSDLTSNLGSLELDSLDLDSSELDGSASDLDAIFGSENSVDVEAAPFDFSFDGNEVGSGSDRAELNHHEPDEDTEPSEPNSSDLDWITFPEPEPIALSGSLVEASDVEISDTEASDAEIFDTLEPIDLLEPDAASSSESIQQADFDPFFAIDPEVSIQENIQGFESAEDEMPDAEMSLSESLSEEITLDTEDDFADLEAMLEDSALGEVSQANAELAVQEDDFADLEAMLGEEPSHASSQTIASSQIGQITESSEAEDEFGDLEDLLEDVKQKLGGSSAQRSNRQASTPANRRTNRRNVLSDQTMRVSVKHLDNLNNLVGEMVVNRNSLEQAQERLRQFLDNLLYQVQQLSDVGQRMRDLYERSLLESSLLSNRRSYHLSPQSSFAPAPSNHATGASFDALEMDRFTGFHTLSQEMIELIVRVRESASDIDFVVEESDQVTRNFRQITTQLQEGLTRSRMVPFAQTADRLPRGVRDNSLKYGKQSELHIEGRDTLIDKMIVEQLYDPMTHLVNNAVAHGIETPAVRVAGGKPPTGKITIRAFHQGNQTIISVSDDGGGIDPDYVKSKAVARGLVTPAEAKEMTRLDVYDLLFHHGFSTADQVDDLKGRGVGLDVVRSNLNEIRGVISIDSTIGKGTTFTIRLPLTLSISKALCCISNRARVAFPMDGVEDMLDVPKERIQTDEQGGTSIYWRDALLPFQSLSTLLGYNRMLGRGSVYGGNQEEDIISIVVLRSAGNYLALQVDQVLGEQEIVIKQLEGPVPKPVGVAGATVLGDGRIMPIADVLELIDLSEGRIRREAGSSLWDKSDELPPEPADLKTEPTVLIVDDSITVRELLSMTFNKVGYRVEQARDGQEAWEKLRSGLPCDLVFCDIEMPRMDGLELLSRIQKDPALAHLPIAMLTSRGADRHRQMAVQLGAKGYFTKPYLEEGLLDAAQRMLKGEVLVNTNL
ncbi:MAG: response regulator [Drouetiella hepatica Uher 2000/2452]|jgi:chemosensory pili system protein ChpA (sensor histidine kinase/response regulator)|uniref:histidine kinase n=1 Tax=Drouetiella hepatica Uher 2000/2452 TaxID=904376 RepID=A0A951QE25_9CYAN|nr:response regulator [Drouetiella hepatica Uher 2000/2452]